MNAPWTTPDPEQPERHLSNTAQPPALCGGSGGFVYDLRWYDPAVANCATCRALGGAPPGDSILDIESRTKVRISDPVRRFRFRTWQRFWFGSWVNGKPPRNLRESRGLPAR